MFSSEVINQELNNLGLFEVAEEFNILSNHKGNRIPNFFYRHNEFQGKLFDEAYQTMVPSKEKIEDFAKLLKSFEKIDVPISHKISLKLKNIIPSEKIDLLDIDILKHFTDVNCCLKIKPFILFIENQQLLLQGLEDLNKIQNFSDTKAISFETLQQFILFKILENPEAFPDDLSPRWYQDYYLDYVTKKIIFDTKSSSDGKILIQNLLNSSSFLDILSLSNSSQYNSLSYENVTNVRIQFETICSKGKGMHVEMKDMKDIYMFSFTNVFLDRLYQIIDTEDGMATFNGFIDFYLPLRFIKEPQSVKFFFNVFDIDGDGVITKDDIYYFYRGLANEVESEVTFDFFCNMLIDLVNSDMNITLDKLQKSSKAEDFICVLIDSSKYEQMFSIIHDEEEDLIDCDDLDSPPEIE